MKTLARKGRVYFVPNQICSGVSFVSFSHTGGAFSYDLHSYSSQPTGVGHRHLTCSTAASRYGRSADSARFATSSVFSRFQPHDSHSPVPASRRPSCPRRTASRGCTTSSTSTGDAGCRPASRTRFAAARSTRSWCGRASGSSRST